MPTAVAQLALRFGPAQLAGIETGLSAVYSCWLGVLPGQLRGRLVLTDPTTDLDATDIEVFGHRKQRVGRTGWNDTAGMKSGRVHLASWGGADLPLAMDLLAGNDDVRPGAAALRRRALAALPAAVCGRVRVRADAGNLDGALARAATRAGCEAALAAKGNTAVRDIEDQAFALDGSLDSTEKGKAVLDSSYIDLVLGAGQDCKTIQAEGRASSAMTANQQMGLLTLIDHDGGLANDEDAAAREAQLKADLAATTFAWCGPTSGQRRVRPAHGPALGHRVLAAVDGWRRRRPHPRDLPRPHQRSRGTACS